MPGFAADEPSPAAPISPRGRARSPGRAQHTETKSTLTAPRGPRPSFETRRGSVLARARRPGTRSRVHESEVPHGLPGRRERRPRAPPRLRRGQVGLPLECLPQDGSIARAEHHAKPVAPVDGRQLLWCGDVPWSVSKSAGGHAQDAVVEAFVLPRVNASSLNTLWPVHESRTQRNQARDNQLN